MSMQEQKADVVMAVFLENEHQPLCESYSIDCPFLALLFGHRHRCNRLCNTMSCRWHCAHRPDNTFMILVQPEK